MNNDNMNQVVEIQEIIQLAVKDTEFRDRLLNDTDEVLKDYNTSEVTRIMIKSLTKEDFDVLNEDNIQEYFAVDSSIYTPDFDTTIETEEANEDDI